MSAAKRTRPVLFISASEFNRLPEYSMSLPTGTRIGKRWKRELRRNSAWSGDYVIGEYHDIGSDTEIGIRWFDPIIKREAAP